MLVGKHITHMIAEELSGVCPTAGKATDNAAVLLNQSRKFGGIFHGVSQKPQEVAKTYFDQCGIKFIGLQKGAAMRRRMAGEIGLMPEQIGELQPLQFYRDDGSAGVPAFWVCRVDRAEYDTLRGNKPSRLYAVVDTRHPATNRVPSLTIEGTTMKTYRCRTPETIMHMQESLPGRHFGID